MSPGDQILKVFISSTSEDLRAHRAVARNAVLEAGWFPVMMENFGSMPEQTVTACEKKLAESDLMILLVAFRRGYVPTENQGGNGKDSITALEWKYAKEQGKDILIFMADPKKPWSPAYIDADRTWIDNFRNSLNQPAGWFAYEDTAGNESDFPIFRATVYGALLNYKENLRQKGKDDLGPAPPDSENFSGASKRLLSRKCIPFLGPGVYGQGPLSPCALRKDLGDEACEKCDDEHESCQKSCLATAAQFHSDDRDIFLTDLKDIIQRQAKVATIPLVYNLIQQIKPPLIVSATWDLLLEQTLWAGGQQRCLILCHAIRGGESEGILLFNGPQDNFPRLYPATDIPAINFDAEEKLEPEQRSFIIYKPFGSPLLSSGETDTVVITEEDYTILLRRLDKTDSGVPNSFITCFRKYPPIFLGYPMDMWHFRLMGQFFRSISPEEKLKLRRFAVRIADLPLEKKAWKGLGVDLVSMDLSEFSRKVQDTLQKSGVSL